MATKLLVTLRYREEAEAVRSSGVEILAEYPDSMLVRCTDDQVRLLDERGVEATPLPESPVRVSGASFAFADAIHAQESVVVEPRAGRTAYYLVKLVGPPAAGWLSELEESGATVHGNLQGFTLLVGVLPELVEAIRSRPWVEEVTPFRPTMKVSPRLRRSAGRELDADHLATEDAEDFGDGRTQLVEVSVFPGESTDEVAGRIVEEGGLVMTRLPGSLVASVPRSAIVELADLQGIQAILPFAYSQMENDKARAIIGVPEGYAFGDTVLKGAGQIVGVADSGLDTGDPDTIHPDVRGRVAGIASWPVRAILAPYANDPPEHDDGPADVESGHGTHVTGSVLGDGAAAVASASAAVEARPVPAGVAPEAQVYFQSIGQTVRWKSIEELEEVGLRPFQEPWPPPANSLYGIPHDITALFAQAYEAGARVHTNSWGAPVDGVYNQNARAVDEFMWAHPDMLILFAAGNSGVDADADGMIDPDSIGAPGTAKNCLTVGASENDRPSTSDPVPGANRDWKDIDRYPKLGPAGHVSDDPHGMAAFSSRGPTDDQRVKPDVVAPGTNVLSMLSSVFPADREPLWGRLTEGHALRLHYCWSGGTSMATPLVAGAAALVRQFLLDRDCPEAGRGPSSALLKAVLVNGAVPMRGQFPGEVPEGTNNVSGFGRVDVRRSVAPEPLRRLLFTDEPEDGVSTGQTRTYRVRAAGTGTPLKATLVWTDAPSQVGADGLENRLYLRVRTPDGEVVDGDVSAFPEPVNNVQQVVIDAPVEGGEYEVRVHGVSVPHQSPGAIEGAGPRQDFAVAVAGAVADAGSGLR
ncbi:S8 family serine peptidase [Glycomyces sp. L485]|uniref:S8 family serine peptidase n=1 Tax=Glycomyces sp. L485 TaxID=2909235 RepID=UPI001F4ACC81|nr:S8 family serine peptidase [Glycomyces sp. L485]MCH7230266.1 S8 family serine peptidase [Glycomyces sp. L485]